MESILGKKEMVKYLRKTEELGDTAAANLAQASLSTEYCIKDIRTNDEELKSFLFTLGCYKGEYVTLISILAENYVINIKDARYSIDKKMAEAIIITEYPFSLESLYSRTDV